MAAQELGEGERQVIVIPKQFGYDGPWMINSPWLKLQLKYGIVGPWSGSNWSMDFDGYAERRGLKQVQCTGLGESTISKQIAGVGEARPCLALARGRSSLPPAVTREHPPCLTRSSSVLMNVGNLSPGVFHESA